jgi:hypothetical protein
MMDEPTQAEISATEWGSAQDWRGVDVPAEDEGVSRDHALRIGLVLGMALRAGLELVPDLDAERKPTGRLRLLLPDALSGVEVYLIVEAPRRG